MQKALNFISENIYLSIKNSNFSKEEIKDNNSAVFTNGNIFYKITFDENKNQIFLLKSTSKENDAWENVSAWLFDANSNEKKDAEIIANDFKKIIIGEKNTSLKPAKREKKDKSNTVDPLFFMNRLVNIFPELRQEIQLEKESYSEFRSVTFAKLNVVPKIKNLLNENLNSNKVKKLCNLLSDMYNHGNLDVRSIITIVILNSIDNEEHLEKVKELLSDELKKAFKFSYKLKGKKIKPKKFKKSFLMSKLK